MVFLHGKDNIIEFGKLFMFFNFDGLKCNNLILQTT